MLRVARAQAKLNEGGDEVDASEAASLVAPTPQLQYAVQPIFPAGDFHDSLQYHFFCGPVTVAARVFHTQSL